ncbi:MAG: hypothetical protein ACD_63C00106G0008 [uncultured bacterium]|nr:MAG: hypothetical protein ACD_63C00106G0008 [uncultured bacterium]
MESIQLPSKIEFSKLEDREATFVIDPLFPGYGITIGNALRRVLLSSLPGAAVTAVKIEGVNHEFSAIKDVKEDMVEIVLNLKKLRMKIHTDKPVVMKISKKGKGKVYAKDIEANSDVEIVNPDLLIATMASNKAKLDMEISAKMGRGYVPVEQRDKEKIELGTLAIDSIYTPIRSVSFQVDNVRVGQMTDFDKVTMHIKTDGTLTPKEAVDQAAQILVDHFSLFTNVKKKKHEKPQKENLAKEKVKKEKVADLGGADDSVENLGLSTRTTNALYSAGLKKLSDIVSKNEETLLDLNGFGETALKEVKKLLKKKKLNLKE